MAQLIKFYHLLAKRFLTERTIELARQMSVAPAHWRTISDIARKIKTNEETLCVSDLRETFSRKSFSKPLQKALTNTKSIIKTTNIKAFLVLWPETQSVSSFFSKKERF